MISVGLSARVVDHEAEGRLGREPERRLLRCLTKRGWVVDGPLLSKKADTGYLTTVFWLALAAECLGLYVMVSACSFNTGGFMHLSTGSR